MTDSGVANWLLPVLLCLFVVGMLITGILLCYKLRKRKTSNNCDANCPGKPKSKAKSFLANTIFFTKSSEKAAEGPLYKTCTCKQKVCRRCKASNCADSPAFGMMQYYNGTPIEHEDSWSVLSYSQWESKPHTFPIHALSRVWQLLLIYFLYNTYLHTQLF